MVPVEVRLWSVERIMTNNDCKHYYHFFNLSTSFEKTGRCFQNVLQYLCQFDISLAPIVVPPGHVYLSQLAFLCLSRLNTKRSMKKQKGKVLGTADSRLLHSLQVAKMSSEVNSPTPHLGLCCCESFSQPASPETVIFPLPLCNFFPGLCGKCFPLSWQRLLFF